MTRRQDEKDQRVVKIHLAPKGEECIEGIQRVICEMEEIVYQGISREEILDEAPSDRNENNLLNSKDFKGVDMDTIIERHVHRHVGVFSNRIYRRNWIGQIRCI